MFIHVYTTCFEVKRVISILGFTTWFPFMVIIIELLKQVFLPLCQFPDCGPMPISSNASCADVCSLISLGACLKVLVSIKKRPLSSSFFPSTKIPRKSAFHGKMSSWFPSEDGNMWSNLAIACYPFPWNPLNHEDFPKNSHGIFPNSMAFNHRLLPLFRRARLEATDAYVGIMANHGEWRYLDLTISKIPWRSIYLEVKLCLILGYNIYSIVISIDQS